MYDNAGYHMQAIEFHRPTGIAMKHCHLTMEWQVFSVQIKTLVIFSL